MNLPRRREKDETRKLKKMGEALGWTSYQTKSGRAIANPNYRDNALEVPGKGHVDTRAYDGGTPARFKGTKGIGGQK